MSTRAGTYRPLTVLVTGVSGAGKTTVARRLAQWGYPTISLDADTALCGWVDQAGHRATRPAAPDTGWLNAHRWVWDRHRLQEIITVGVGEAATVRWLCGRADNAPELADLPNSPVGTYGPTGWPSASTMSLTPAARTATGSVISTSTANTNRIIFALMGRV